MRFLYDLVLFFYHSGIRLLAFFHPKAKLWVEGRKGVIENIPPPQAGQRRIWMHCASLGEFEQGRPILEALKAEHPDCFMLLTFYSPSGYEIRKDYPLADHVCYLPADTAQNARRFVAAVQADLVIFVKYELWYHYLRVLQQQQIPTILVAALFRPHQIFFRFYGAFFRKILFCFESIFVQNAASADLLLGVSYTSVEIVGDPRIDRVLTLAEQVCPLPIIQKFTQGHPVLIAGSTWPADEALLLNFLATLPQNWKVIIAPHEIHPKALESLQQKLTLPNLRYSQAEALNSSTRILLIDNIGMLASIYQYGKIAYIGGGFGRGIHNILEPAVFGLPIIFGRSTRATASENCW